MLRFCSKFQELANGEAGSSQDESSSDPKMKSVFQDENGAVDLMSVCRGKYAKFSNRILKGKPVFDEDRLDSLAQRRIGKTLE